MTFKLPFNLHEDCKIQTVQELVEIGILKPPLDGNHGEKHPTASDYVDKGIPFVMASDLVNGSIDFKNCKYISLKTAKKLRKGFAHENDVLITHKATIGRTAIVPKLSTQYIILTPQVTYYRIKNPEILNPNYLKYYFDSDFFQNLLKTWAGAGSTRAYLGITAQLKLPVIIPPIHIQNSIVDVVSPINKKRKINSETNCTLESIAQAIFKSWFIDFDPVHAKVKAIRDGRDPELAAMATIAGKSEAEIKKLKGKNTKLANELLKLENLRHIASLFPSEFVDSELGSIPNDWTWSKIGNEVSIAGGGTPSTKIKEYWENGKNHWATPKDLSGLKDNILLNTERKITDLGLSKISSGQLPKETVLMSSRAPVGYLAITKIPISINQGFIAMISNRFLPNTYILQWCYFNMPEIEQHAGGSTFAEISKKNFKPMKIIVPNGEIVNEYHKLTSKIYDLITNNACENQNLMSLRDYMLPKLISGEMILNRNNSSNQDSPMETNMTECQDGN